VERNRPRPSATVAIRPAGDPDSPDERAAAMLIQQITGAQAEGDFRAAKAGLVELRTTYGGTQAAVSAPRLAAEIDVVDTAAAPLQVEKWYQGEGNLDAKGATLVVFWESWCPHCLREMPHVQALYDHYGRRGLDVVGLTNVTRSATDETVTRFIADHGLTFPIGKDHDRTLSDAYAVSGVPAAAIVKDGVVVWRGHPGRLTPDLVEEILDHHSQVGAYSGPRR
jgi:thiol-disulfide isomerase/thioredoxin